MAILSSIAYDPGTAVTNKATTAALAMTAFDTTNLRNTFNAPSNGAVLVRLAGITHGATTEPQVLLGILESSTVKGRLAPAGAAINALATQSLMREAIFVVPGLTPSQSYTWDAAYGVETLVASTNFKYGGPNNTTTNDAFGAFMFEVWETPTLLGAVLYDPSTAVTKSTTALLAMTAFDTTNARVTFNAPSSGRIFWRIHTVFHGSTTTGQVMLGILDGSTVKARHAPTFGRTAGTTAATTLFTCVASGVIGGLTPTQSYSYDAAYGVEIVSGAGGLKYGGPNNATANDAFGALAFEIWAA